MEASQSSAVCFLASLRNSLLAFLRRVLLWILSAGPIPQHIAIIMDGNRRFADRHCIDKRSGHVRGSDRLMRVLKDCFDLHVRFVTLYAFSIDNYKRSSEEVSALMELMQEKLEALIEKENLVREHGVRVNVLGDLSLLPDGVRNAAERAMAVTKSNHSAVLNLCISYTSTHEIVHSVQTILNDLVCKLGKGYEGAESQTDCERWQSGVMQHSIEAPSTGLRKRSFQSKQVSSDVSPAAKSELEDIVEACKDDFQFCATKEDQLFSFPENANSCINVMPSKSGLKDTKMVGGDDLDPGTLSSNCPLQEHISMESVVCRRDDGVRSQQHTSEKLFGSRQDAVSAVAEAGAGTKDGPVINTRELEGSGARDFKGSLSSENGLSNNCMCGHSDDSADGILRIITDRITEDQIQQHLYTDSCPPPDIVLRTSGETRLSNFLLWQSSFSHLAFRKVLWPDFSFRHLFSVILEYQRAYSSLLRNRHLCNQILCKGHEVSCSSVWAS